MKGQMTTRIAVGTATLSLLLLLGAPDATADDDLMTAVKEMAEQVKEHKSAGDITALTADVKAVEALYKRCATDKKACKAVVKVLGNMTRTAKQESEARVIEAALLALGRIGHPDGAKYIATYLKQPKAKDVPPQLLSALKAAKELRSDTHVKSLLKLVEKSKVTAVALGSMEALSNFGHNTRTREMILERLVKTVLKDKPGTRPNDRSGANTGNSDPVHVPYSYGGPTGRWNALSPNLPKVLNALTGESFGTAEEWMGALDAYKKDLSALFSNKDLEEE